jgi:hypothetical protein
MYNDELEKKPMIKHEMEKRFKLEVPLLIWEWEKKTGWRRII